MTSLAQVLQRLGLLDELLEYEEPGKTMTLATASFRPLVSIVDVPVCCICRKPNLCFPPLLFNLCCSNTGRTSSAEQCQLSLLIRSHGKCVTDAVSEWIWDRGASGSNSAPLTVECTSQSTGGQPCVVAIADFVRAAMVSGLATPLHQYRPEQCLKRQLSGVLTMKGIFAPYSLGSG